MLQFRPKIWTNRREESHQIALSSGGFTLIELLVVIGIIVMISMTVIPNVSSYFQISLNSATRDLSSVIKEAFNSSVITGNVYRIVFDLKKNAYWVEVGPATALLDTKESLEKAEDRKRFDQNSKDSENKAPPSEFKKDDTILRNKKDLPRGVKYEDVLTQQSKVPITSGIAYCHFFPNGLSEQTIIHLKDSSSHHASLVVTPILGMTDLYDRYVNEKEAFEE